MDRAEDRPVRIDTTTSMGEEVVTESVLDDNEPIPILVNVVGCQMCR